MKEYVYAIYGYLLDIDLYFRGRDEETILLIHEMKKAVDRYIKNPSKTTFEPIYKLKDGFYEDGKIKNKYVSVQAQVNNLDEMIFRTKKELYKFN